MKLALGLSLTLHAIIFAAYRWRMPNPPPPPPAKIEIQIQEVAGNPNTNKSASKSKSRAHAGKKGNAAKSLGAKFGPGILSAHFNGGARGAGTTLTDDGGTGFREEDWGSHGARLEEIEHFNKYEKLFAHLQGMVEYPGRLGFHGMEDTLNARLAFDENSHCDWTKSRIGGTNPYFRVFTLAILKKLCSLETIEKIGFTKNQFVDLSFNFVIISLPEQNPRGDFIQGNVFSFRRTFIKPDFVVEAGPVYWSPLAPGMVYMNFPWIFEHWEKWVEGKDPLREFKQ